MLQEKWHIQLLGELRARMGDHRITRFPTQKTGALLAYLAYYVRRHSRETLGTLLWPDDDPGAVRNRLRVALASLRRQLEPPGVPTGCVLLADRADVRLNPDAVTTDVATFEACLAESGRCPGDAERIALLTKAAELYTGDLLPGYYEEWILTERERLAAEFLTALRRLVRCLAHVRDFDRALAFAQRALRTDPLREESHRDLMRLYTATGQPSAALNQFRELERLLKDELGARPSAASQQLAAQIEARLGHGGGERPAIISTPAVTPPAAPVTPSPPESPGSLPLSLTRFFGREEEIAQLVELCGGMGVGEYGRKDTSTLTRPHSHTRLITLTGPGGSGKTRLAREVANRVKEAFPGGVWFVSLADLSDPRLIPGAIASVMRLPRSPNVEPLEQVVEFLNQRVIGNQTRSPVLLVLDNFEQLVEDGARAVQSLLERVASLTCLATSRRSLRLMGEREFPVRPLPTPDRSSGVLGYWSDGHNIPTLHYSLTPERLMSYPSVQLFVDRAQAVRPDFQVTARNAGEVAALCQRLEGLPLAIELAAARTWGLTPAQMLERLNRRLDLLVNRRAGKDIRHRSLHAAIEWSYRLLPPPLRRFFARLSIFQGGWTLEAAEVATQSDARHPTPDTLDMLEQLRENSLIRAEEGATGMRFRMMESLREFASEQLKPEERIMLARRHAEYFLEMAEEARPHLNGPEAVAWLMRVDEEHDNLRAALSGAIARGEAETALRLIVALDAFWDRRGHMTEGRAHLRQALSLDGAPPLLRSRALCMAGVYAREQGDYAEAMALFSESLTLAEQHGDQSVVADALYGLGIVVYVQRDYARSRSLIEQSLALRRALGDLRGTAHSLNILGLLAWRADQNRERARTFYEAAQNLLAEVGDRHSLSVVWNNLGVLANETGNPEEATVFFQSCQRIYQETGDYWSQSTVWNNLGVLAQKRRDFAAAIAAYHESLRFSHPIIDRRLLSETLWNLASTCHDVGDHARAARLLAASERLWEVFSPLNLEEQAIHDRITVAARAAMGEAIFSAAWAEGRAMSLEEAIRYALETTCPRPGI